MNEWTVAVRTDRRGHHSSPSPAGLVVAQGFARSNAAASSCNTTPANATCSMSMTISVNVPRPVTPRTHHICFTNKSLDFTYRTMRFHKIIHEVLNDKRKVISRDRRAAQTS